MVRPADPLRKRRPRLHPCPRQAVLLGRDRQHWQCARRHRLAEALDAEQDHPVRRRPQASIVPKIVPLSPFRAQPSSSAAVTASRSSPWEPDCGCPVAGETPRHRTLLLQGSATPRGPPTVDRTSTLMTRSGVPAWSGTGARHVKRAVAPGRSLPDHPPPRGRPTPNTSGRHVPATGGGGIKSRIPSFARAGGPVNGPGGRCPRDPAEPAGCDRGVAVRPRLGPGVSGERSGGVGPRTARGADAGDDDLVGERRRSDHRGRGDGRRPDRRRPTAPSPESGGGGWLRRAAAPTAPPPRRPRSRLEPRRAPSRPDLAPARGAGGRWLGRPRSPAPCRRRRRP